VLLLALSNDKHGGRVEGEREMSWREAGPYRSQKQWVNEIEDGLWTRATKNAAVATGRDGAMARKIEHVIYNMDGSIAERNSYGNDPFRPPG
jgi:hypothetical protein